MKGYIVENYVGSECFTYILTIENHKIPPYFLISCQIS
uniref:Uncharacterized protein n=1 Tax=Siphoviridae sp. cttFh17 TaxID=2826491 RepID=A0A8S5NJS8_9CAUD|nr:MAG TPA: hypothetical protein [Siphoviridae sp. cttFh17]DAW05712.1 MAG TPA: hypothetical protein [Caudoviricetes sp.]